MFGVEYSSECFSGFALHDGSVQTPESDSQHAPSSGNANRARAAVRTDS